LISNYEKHDDKIKVAIDTPTLMGIPWEKKNFFGRYVTIYSV